MKRVLIANRGEIACRIMDSCKELGLETVAVYSDADAKALHAERADLARYIGPAPARASYLNIDAVLQAAVDSGADAVHPGYGFLSESSEFARRVMEAGLTWIGTHPDTIRNMGDKERAREIAQAASVPVLPGSHRFVDGALDGLAEAGEAVGYPLLVKAASGGGGIGMRLVEDPSKLAKIAAATQSMAKKAFGDGTIFLERYVRNARHVEVQVFGFGDGDAVHFYERDCSLQRRYQKVIEESPAPGLPLYIREAMTEVAVALCRHQAYGGAGTVEFVFDTDNNDFFFLEMNTRIQVEHPVTELCTEVDLVAMQLRQAAGEQPQLSQNAVEHFGHSIECRIYAENPAKHFLPSPGLLEEFTLPRAADGIRIDCGLREGDEVSMFYDPMIAKLSCRAGTRAAAIDKMIHLLEDVRIRGVRTNRDFLLRCLRHPAFREGHLSTGFIDKHYDELIEQA